MTRGRAIKLYCFECAGDNSYEVLLCHLYDCPLWPFRTTNHEKRLKKYLEGHPVVAKELKYIRGENQKPCS